MPLIDERGRLFGRVNLIDAVVALLVLVLIPLGYGAYFLFKTPIPTITGIEPAEIILHETLRVRLLGTDLRPFLHARVGTVEAKGFLVLSPSEGEIKLPDDLEAGTLDVALYDDAQELVRKVGAVTVVPKPPPPVALVRNMQVQVIGSLVGLKTEMKAAFPVGTVFEAREEEPAPGKPKPAVPPRSKEPIAVVVAARPAERDLQRIKIGSNAYVNASVVDLWRIPSILKLTCVEGAGECKVGEAPVTQGTTIRLPFSRKRTGDEGASGDARKPGVVSEEIKFVIDDVRAVDAPLTFPVVRTAVATIHVRFMAPVEVANRFKVGDLDFFEPLPASDTERASLIAIGGERETMTALQQIDTPTRRNFQVQQPVVLFNATVRVPVIGRGDSWLYKERPVKIGAPFSFEGPGAASAGWILDVSIGRPTERSLP